MPGSAINAGRNGLAKLGWLRMLKNSARNCAFSFSVIAVFLYSARSHCLKVGPRRASRPRLPKCRVPGTQSEAEPDALATLIVLGLANELISSKFLVSSPA